MAEHESTGAVSAAVRRSAARDNRGDRRGGPCPVEEPRDPNVAIQPCVFFAAREGGEY